MVIVKGGEEGRDIVGRQFVGEQSQRGLNSSALVNSSALANHECSALVNSGALKEIVRRRSNSPKCVSWTSPYEVSGKKTRNDTQESIRSKNLDRPRALVPSH